MPTLAASVARSAIDRERAPVDGAYSSDEAQVACPSGCPDPHLAGVAQRRELARRDVPAVHSRAARRPARRGEGAGLGVVVAKAVAGVVGIGPVVATP